MRVDINQSSQTPTACTGGCTIPLVGRAGANGVSVERQNCGPGK